MPCVGASGIRLHCRALARGQGPLRDAPRLLPYSQHLGSSGLAGRHVGSHKLNQRAQRWHSVPKWRNVL